MRPVVQTATGCPGLPVFYDWVAKEDEKKAKQGVDHDIQGDDYASGYIEEVSVTAESGKDAGPFNQDCRLPEKHRECVQEGNEI